jgi:hypothetical protein
MLSKIDSLAWLQ